MSRPVSRSPVRAVTQEPAAGSSRASSTSSISASVKRSGRVLAAIMRSVSRCTSARSSASTSGTSRYVIFNALCLIRSCADGGQGRREGLHGPLSGNTATPAGCSTGRASSSRDRGIDTWSECRSPQAPQRRNLDESTLGKPGITTRRVSHPGRTSRGSTQAPAPRRPRADFLRCRRSWGGPVRVVAGPSDRQPGT
jgi:hypothetical protein